MSESLHDEVIRVARDLIRLDTTNAREPGLGNETRCAEYLHDYLSGYGVECELVARVPHRANLVARIPGVVSTSSTDGRTGSTDGRTGSTDGRTGSTDGPADSLAFVGHTDVVPCDPRDWTHPPFEGGARRRRLAVGPRRGRHEERDGRARGRDGASWRGRVSGRAVTCWFLAVADEEDGFDDVGMRWLVGSATRPAGRLRDRRGRRRPARARRRPRLVGPIEWAQKATLPVGVTALGEAGHASRPESGANAVPRWRELVRAPRHRPAGAAPRSPRRRGCSTCWPGRGEPTSTQRIAEGVGAAPDLGARRACRRCSRPRWRRRACRRRTRGT